jgi:hypothetical protein
MRYRGAERDHRAHGVIRPAKRFVPVRRARTTYRRHPSLSGSSKAARRVLPIALWAALPVLVALSRMLRIGTGQVLGGDFHYAFWPAGQRVLHGLSPYVDPGSPAIAHAVAFVYPALAALLLVPLGLIPHGSADVLFVSLNLGAALLTLWILGVRDWRLYGLITLCPAVFSGWTLGNVTLLLGLGIAVVWRYRSRPLLVGLLTALLISLKLFLWPIALWLLATRRYSALVYTAVFGLVINLAAWTILGLGEVSRYGRLLHALAALEEQRRYGLVSLALREGASHPLAYALTLATAAAGALACFTCGRRGQPVAALALALAVSLIATPVVQLHYYAILIVPLALVWPRLSIVWALPLAMWVCASPARTWQVAAALGLGAAIVLASVFSDSPDAVKGPEPDQRPDHTGELDHAHALA